MSTKCFRCGKTVYAAEKQVYDGKEFHGLCLTAHKKELKPTLPGLYPGDEDRMTGQLKTEKTKSGVSGGSCPGCHASYSGGERFWYTLQLQVLTPTSASCGHALT